MIEELFTRSSIATTCLVGLTVGLIVYWVQRRLRYKLPPGPFALPLLGNVFQIDSKNMHEQVFGWSKKYGPVVSVYIGPVHMVFVNDIETALEVLVKKSTDFANRIHTSTMDIFSDGGQSIVFGDYGHTWHFLRKLATKALREYMQGPKLEERVFKTVTTTLDEMETLRQEGPFDANEKITLMVANLLATLCFGEMDNYRDLVLKKVLELEDELFLESTLVCMEDFIPPLKYVYKTKNFKKFEEFADLAFNQLIYKRFDEQEKTFNKDNIRHFTDHLLLARLNMEEEEEGSEALKSLTKKHLYQTCSNIFFGGIDTSRLTLGFTILYMLKYPDVQAKVQEEIDRNVGKDCLPGLADRPNLSYTEAVLHESMRLSTVVPFGVMHKTTCDTSAGGYDIPKDTIVAINHWALHHDPDAWEDVDAFKPERFLDENGKMGPKPRNWLPFSAGIRVCLGEFVAKPELHLFFAALMQRFTWKPEPGVTPDVTSLGNVLTRFPPNYKVVLEKRI